MAYRSFKLTLPADTTQHNLYTLMLAVPGAVPVDGILPDRVSYLVVQADLGNNADTITVSDQNTVSTTGLVLNAGDPFIRNSNRNTICLRDFNLKGSLASLICEVAIDSI